jgi:hypothetical protein
MDNSYKVELLRLAKEIIETNLHLVKESHEKNCNGGHSHDPLGYSHYDVIAIAKDLDLFVSGKLDAT